MATNLTDRVIDWVAAPGDAFQYMTHCPPPLCSETVNYSSAWIGTTGSIQVDEVAVAGADPNVISDLEKGLFRKWAFQEVIQGLGFEALMEAEEELDEEFVVEDITLSPKAMRLMSATFKIRADNVAAASSGTSGHSSTT